jgi:hypothetical protein
MYRGEGIEVSELNSDYSNLLDTLSRARGLSSMVSSTGSAATSLTSFKTSSSFDEGLLDRDKVFREMKQSLSDEDMMRGFFLGNSSKSFCLSDALCACWSFL